MRKLILLAIISLLTIRVYGQTGQVRGQVLDSITKKPVDFATISIYKQNSKSPVNGVSADAKGNFAVQGLQAGDYRLAVDFIGYRQKTFEHVIVDRLTRTVTLGRVLLEPVSRQLQGVTVTAKTPVVETKIDKMIYNAANDLTVQGGMALDVLKKVPMVSVDIDGNVELLGSSGIRFLINGKPSSIFGASLADALQSIPASQIKSIEVITSPGAKYDAQGTGGIINIVLKDNKLQGLNGSINLSAGTRLENGSINLNARKGTFGIGIFLNGNSQLRTTTRSSSERTSYNNSRDTLRQLFQNGSSPFTRRSYQTGINFNWTITPKDELTATFGYNRFRNNTSGIITQDQKTVLPAGLILTDLMSIRNSTSYFDEKATDMSLGYKKTFKKDGQELDLLYTTSLGSNLTNAAQLTDYSGRVPMYGQRSENPGKDHQTEVTLDYTHPISKSFIIETGAKVFIGNLNSSVVTDTLTNGGVYNRNLFQTYSFNYQRHIYAAYLSASFSLFNKFLSGKAGLRYEHTNTTGSFSGASIPGYNTFAPSLVVQHRIDDAQSVKVSYSYRIERPDYEDLNPFYNISDPHNISTGNPLLKPEVGHNFEFGYNKNFGSGGTIYVAAIYRNSLDNIQSLTTYYEVLDINGTAYTAVSLNRRFNLGSQKNIGVNISGTVPVTEKFNLRSNIQLGERISSTSGLASVKALAYRANLNASYQFPHDLIVEIFGNYNSSQKNIQSQRPAFFTYNLALRKQFLNKNASIGFTAANPFAYYINQRQQFFGANFDQVNLRRIPSQSFGITFSYKFGKLKFDKEKDNAAPAMPDLGGQ